MSPVLPVVPFHGSSEESSVLVNSRMTSKFLRVAIQYDPVCASFFDSNSVITEAVGWVEVEDEHQAGTLKHNHLVSLVLERDVRLWCMKPAVLCLGQVHVLVKVVEELVAQQVVIRQIELSSSVPE